MRERGKKIRNTDKLYHKRIVVMPFSCTGRWNMLFLKKGEGVHVPTKTNLKALSFGEGEKFCQALGWPRYRADQILAAIYQRRVDSFEEMTDISKQDRALLNERAQISHLTCLHRSVSMDGTQKFLFLCEDGQSIETVLIPDSGRLTLCISTQVGCALDCQFCFTGEIGLTRNLLAHEIVDQIIQVQKLLSDGQRITSVVMMGMGEPLANTPRVFEAIERITDLKRGIGISPRRITLSTVGIVPQIRRVGEIPHKINLSVSLNATTNQVRDRLMPINKKYPIEELLAACRAYPLPPRRRITFEYVLLSGVNDSLADARRLVLLLRGIRCKINLIPFNEYPGAEFSCPPDETIHTFQKVLLDAGLSAFIRKSRGRDILAACGQLAGQAGHVGVGSS